MKKTVTYKQLFTLPLCGLLCFTFCVGGKAIPQRGVSAEESVSSVQQSIDAAEDGATVALTENCSDALTVGANKNITLDLAGYEVSATLTNNGTLTLTDSVGTGAFRMTSAVSDTVSAVVNNGSLTVDGADVECTGTGSGTIANAITNSKAATLTYLNGDVKAVSTSTKWGFAIQNDGTIAEIGGGTVTSQIANAGSGSNAIAVNNSGTIEKITGGEITAEHSGTGYAAAIRLNANATVGEITGGEITAKHSGTGVSEAIYILGDAKVDKITGGRLYATVSNPSAGDKHLAYGVNNAGTIGEIGGGTIIGESTATQWAFGINNTGTIHSISGGELVAVIDHQKNAPNAVALANTGTVGAVSGGTFYAASTTASGYTCGIRTQGTGKVNSLSGGAVYLSKPNDTYYFFNNGATMAIDEGYSLSPASSQTSYRYVLPQGGSYTEEYLSENADEMTATVFGADEIAVQTYSLYGTSRKDAAAIGEVQYASLDEAIAASNEGDTVVVLKNAESGVTVPDGKYVTIDLNGKEIKGSVVNNGTLKLIDSQGTGRLYKSTSASGLDPLIANHGALEYNVKARIDGIGNGPEADGIYNYEGATLTVTGGALYAVSYGTKWSHGIVNEGTVTVTGGDIRSYSFSADTSSNIVALSNIKNGVVTEISGGVFYAQTVGKGGSAVGIRTQSNSVVQAVSGGVVKAVANSATLGAAEAYGIYLEGAATSVTVVGGDISAVNHAEYAFGIWNKGTLSVGGGRVSASAPHNAKENNTLNVMAISNEAGAEAAVSGGFLHADSQTAIGATYAVRNRGGLTVSGGAFEITKTENDHIYTESGTTDFNGVALQTMRSETVKYAAAESDVIVEQLFGKNFIGVDVFRNGNAVYGYHKYEKEGYYLSRFVAEGESDMIGQDAFETLTQSTTVYAEYEKAPLYYFVGSSVTYGHANNGSSFVNEIADMLNCVCVKEAISGTTLANNGSGSYVARMINNLDKNAEVEHLIVQLSTNDVTQNVPRGTISSSKNIEEIDNTTTLGAIEFIIAYAKMTWNCDVTFYTNPNYNNAVYESLIEDLYAIQQKWGIGVLDFYHYTDMEALDTATLNSYMADSIHPNALGYRWMGEVFSEYLRNLFALRHGGAEI